MDWNGLKDEAARLLFEKDALHIYAAVLIQLVVARWSNRSLADLRPWAAVLALELVNEVVDVARGGEARLMAWQVVSAVHDIVNTMILPTILLLLTRHAPELFSRRVE
jgi:hypothetical protein